MKNILIIALATVAGLALAQGGNSHTAVVDGLVTTAERANDRQGEHYLVLPAPITRWDNALPLGNGMNGGLLWGEGRELRLSLDRGDLWDERGSEYALSPRRTFATLLKSIEERDRQTFDRYFCTGVYRGDLGQFSHGAEGSGNGSKRTRGI